MVGMSSGMLRCVVGLTDVNISKDQACSAQKTRVLDLHWKCEVSHTQVFLALRK
jgi:hypothetical protein